ncbi:MAG TPA: cobalamin-binding protein [Pyrinomonadaceae bacterium]|nr:cobalamin-binding protein [Pyrinomonadaceae bacterium]
MSVLTSTTRKVKTALLGLCGVLLFCACAKHPSPPVSPAAAREIVDDAGKRIVLPAQVDRVVSLAPNLTEIVFAVGAGDRLVGRTSYCDYPPEARKVAEIGDTLHPNIERIVALHPQLVLVSTASQLEAFTSQLEGHHIAVFVTDPHNLEGVFSSIERIGEIVNRGNQAKQLVEQLRARADAVAQAVSSRPRVRIFYQLYAEPLYTAGRDAFVTDLIRRAGGDSVTANVPGAWPNYSAESALASRPEAIILATGGASGDANSSVAPSLQKSPAALNGRVYKINDDHLSRPGPRSIDGLEEMARALHPEAFNK